MEPGSHDYERSSKKASVSVPIEQLFMTSDQAKARNKAAAKERKSNVHAASSGCGWPEYFLIGKGNAQGLKCRLFLMITDYTKDKIDIVRSTICYRRKIFRHPIILMIRLSFNPRIWRPVVLVGNQD